LPEETPTATVGISGMKDIMLEEESKKELSLVIDEEIKQDLTNAIEKDHQKTEIPEIVGIGEIKFLMPEHEITTTPSVELASENQSDILFLDDTEYSNKSEETETCESVDLKKGNTEQKPVTNDKLSENKVSPVDVIQFDADHSSQSTEDEQVDLKSEASDVIKEDDISSIDGETKTFPNQEVSTDESKKLKTEQTSDESPMPIDQVDESSVDEETLNVDVTSIDEENLPVDQGIKEEIPLTEIVASTLMNLKESSSSFVIEEIIDKSENVIEGSELTREEENHMLITKPGSTMVAANVEGQENVSCEEDPEVPLSEAEQISDLEVTSVKESIVPLPQAAPEVSSEASVDEVTKPAEKEQLAQKASFAESDKLIGPPQVVSPPDQIKTDAFLKTSVEALVIEGSSEVSALKLSSEEFVVKASSEALAFQTFSQVPAIQVLSEDPSVEEASGNSAVKVLSADPAVEISSESEAIQFMEPQNNQ
jgi:hypothetical protein